MTTQAHLNDTIAQTRQKISQLENEKSALQTQMDEAISSKNSTIMVLTIVAIILAVVAVVGIAKAFKK